MEVLSLSLSLSFNLSAKMLLKLFYLFIIYYLFNEQVEECSLRTHILQEKRVPDSLTAEV